MSDEILEIDETLPLPELRKKADEAAQKVQPVTTKPEATEPEGETEFVATRDIDLGDGSGIQVFEGHGDSEVAALEALADKITEAQRNASQKIRQQEAELRDLRTRTAEKPKPKEITEDQEHIWAQEIGKNPSKVVREIIKTVTGRDVETLSKAGERIDRSEDMERRAQITDTFLQTHPDYEDGNTALGATAEQVAAGKRNATALQLAMRGKEWTTENLHKAYLELKQAGLVTLKGDSEAHADTEVKPEATERIAQPRAEVSQTRTRRSSGVSSQARSPAPRTTEPTEDEAYSMPMDKLKALANKQLASR